MKYNRSSLIYLLKKICERWNCKRSVYNDSKKIEPIPNAELYPILFNLIKYFICADEDATGPNEKVNDIFLNQLKNITQASTLQKKSIKRFVNEIFYEGHER